MNRDNQPTFNVNRKIANFGDFSANIDAEKEELKKVKRSTIPNSEVQQHLGNKKLKFNKITRKLDDLSPDEVTDNIDAIEELQERKINENGKPDIPNNKVIELYTDWDEDKGERLVIKTQKGETFYMDGIYSDDDDDKNSW